MLCCMAVTPDQTHGHLLFETILLGILLACLLAGGGIFIALIVLFSPYLWWLGVLIVGAAGFSIYGYIKLLIKLRKSKRRLREKRRAEKAQVKPQNQ